MSIPLLGDKIIKLHNIALAANYNSNLISLGQLRESGITYYNNPMIMTLMRNKKIVVQVKRKQKLFILNFAIPNQVISAKVMAIKGKNHPMHLINKNRRI